MYHIVGGLSDGWVQYLHSGDVCCRSSRNNWLNRFSRINRPCWSHWLHWPCWYYRSNWLVHGYGLDRVPQITTRLNGHRHYHHHSRLLWVVSSWCAANSYN